jgi:hypothetical protein
VVVFIPIWANVVLAWEFWVALRVDQAIALAISANEIIVVLLNNNVPTHHLHAETAFWYFQEVQLYGTEI